jgi:eukaryotic-like serine/threonine-protein kinase
MKPTPLLTQYIQSVENAADCFKTLLPISPIIENGKPKFASGGFAIVFKMQGGDKKNLAVKCFTSEQAERGRRFQKIQQFLKQNPMPFWIDFQYIESELWVNTTPQDGDEYDIVAMPWVEGRTLGEAVREACQRGDKSALRQLLTKFIDMVLLLLALPCAYGDLKHDNIMVGNDGKLYLVDYDGFFVPDFKGEKSQERGSDDYQHPSRNTTTFDRHIDDFSIAIIALSLAALCERPDLYAQYNQGQNLIFSRADFAQNTLSQAKIWAGLNLPKPITELLKYTEQQNSYKLPMLSGYLLQVSEQIGNDLQIWWDNLTDLEREVLTINYKLSKIGWAIPESDKYKSIFDLKYLVKNIFDDIDLYELVRLEKLILKGKWYDNFKLFNLEFIHMFLYLSELNCEGTQISSLLGIEKCINLQILNCSESLLTSLVGLQNCIKLQTLDCASTKISTLSGIENCVSLRNLYCSKTPIKNLSGIKNCKNLKILNCGYTHINSLAGLQNCVNLEELYFESTFVGSLTELQNCLNLRKLQCYNTPIHTLVDLKKCVNLENLYCAKTKINDFLGLENCTHLKLIVCYFSKVTSLIGLENCFKLEELLCYGNAIDSLKPLKNCINLKILYCGWSQITTLEGLENCTQLTILRCQHTKISSFVELQNCSELVEFWCNSLWYRKEEIEKKFPKCKFSHN